jgi:hypothetical protein
MNRIIKSTKLDFYSADSTIITVILIFAFNIITSFLLRNPYNSITNGVSLVSLTSGVIFLVHEGDGKKLYGVLPLKRNELVVGRYLYGMILGVINLILSYILAVVVMITFDMQTSFERINRELLLPVVLMFIFYCAVIGLLYPLYFAIGYKKFMTMLPVIIFLVYNYIALPFLYTVTPDSPGWIDRHFQFFTGSYLYLTVGIGFAIGLAFVVISVVIAYILYKKKEI